VVVRGATVFGSFEYGMQINENRSEGHSLISSFGHGIDVMDIFESAGHGAIFAGGLAFGTMSALAMPRAFATYATASGGYTVARNAMDQHSAPSWAKFGVDAVGDIVLAYNKLTGEIGEYEVTATINHVDEVIIHLYIDGEMILSLDGDYGVVESVVVVDDADQRSFA